MRCPPATRSLSHAAQAIGWPDELVARLVHGGRQVIRFDHRDTGCSDCVDISANPYTLADMAADPLAVLDGHGIDRAHVVGVSLGGAIGQWLAVHHGARVKTLTAIMTSPMGATTQDQPGHEPWPASPPRRTSCHHRRHGSFAT